MSTIFIGDFHPESWLTGKYEQDAIATIFKNINSKYAGQTNLLINGTWFGPQFTHNRVWTDIITLTESGFRVDNVFYLNIIDAAVMGPLDRVLPVLGDPNVFLMGNFPESDHSFYVFSYMVANEFKQYTDDEVLPVDFKYKFINYNRKPKPARVSLVNAMFDAKLHEHGIITLGGTETNEALTVEEEVDHLDNSGENDDLEIPNDIMSLGDIKLWNKHFLNVVSETETNQDSNVFISEKIFKPMIGLRPFIVHGNVNTYKWLRDNGFKTFNHLFPADLEDPKTMEDAVITALQWLSEQTDEALAQIYKDILPDLMYNKQRFFEFAKEQEQKMKDTVSWRNNL